MSATFDKVTVFVTRIRRGRLELLTFLHPLAGRQLPAGSVEDGEAIVAAARRETLEETGIVLDLGLDILGVMTDDLSDQGVMLRETAPAPGNGTTIRRGHKVRIEASHDNQLLVSHRVFDFAVAPPAVREETRGWVDASVVARQLTRHFFHAHVLDDGATEWVNTADGHDLTIQWVPLDRALSLVSGQQEWLDGNFDRIVSTPSVLRDIRN